MKSLHFLSLSVCLLIISISFGQVNHLGFNSRAYYPSLDYVVLKKRSYNGNEVSYSGYGFNNRGSFSIIGIFLDDSHFFLQDNIDLSLVGMSLGNRYKKNNGVQSPKEGSAHILVGGNLGATIGYMHDEGIGAAVNYTLWGANFTTDFEYDFSTINTGLTELRVMVGPFMGQIGYSLNSKVNKMWNAMFNFWFGDDPTESSFGLFLKAENNTTYINNDRSEYNKYNVYSIGIYILY